MKRLEITPTIMNAPSKGLLRFLVLSVFKEAGFDLNKPMHMWVDPKTCNLVYVQYEDGERRTTE